MNQEAARMGEKLEPCPFCGGEPYIERRGTARFSTIISCLECGATHECGDTGDSVGNGWNRRTHHAHLLSRCAELEKALRGLLQEFDDMDEHRPLHAGCVQCTQGATPDRYNTGPCAYHIARAALASQGEGR